MSRIDESVELELQVSELIRILILMMIQRNVGKCCHSIIYMVKAFGGWINPKCNESVTLFCDNKSAIQVAINQNYSQRTIEDEDVTLKYVCSNKWNTSRDNINTAKTCAAKALMWNEYTILDKLVMKWAKEYKRQWSQKIFSDDQGAAETCLDSSQHQKVSISYLGWML